MNIKFCESCGTEFLGEIPGMFVDFFEADPRIHGTIGLPICSECVGTGLVIPEFAELSQKVQKLRDDNFSLQCHLASGWYEKLAQNNWLLLEASQKALSLLRKKNIELIKNCLALSFQK